MKISQAFKMAFAAVLGNKMRSFLTVLGVIIGVIAVSLLITLGESAGSAITSQITDLGSNLVVVTINTRKDYSISLSEIESLQGDNGIDLAAPSVSSNGVVVKANGKDYTASLEGAAPQTESIRTIKLADGRFINEDDMNNRSAVAIVGVNICDELFDSRAVIGETITMLSRRFTIVGVLEEKGQSMMGSVDDQIYIPLTTGQRVFKVAKPRSFYFSAVDAEHVPEAKREIEQFFMHKLKDEDYFNVIDQTQIIDLVDQSMATITGMLSGIAAISLLVGGIGIMNIMLVSVTERTREIGIRKAIGAKRRDILIQFLIESSVISLAGGVIGLAIAFAIATALSGPLGLDMSISMGTINLALGFSIAVGIVFGMYPANKASKLNPIEALRYE